VSVSVSASWNASINRLSRHVEDKNRSTSTWRRRRYCLSAAALSLKHPGDHHTPCLPGGLSPAGARPRVYLEVIHIGEKSGKRARAPPHYGRSGALIPEKNTYQNLTFKSVDFDAFY